MPSTDEWAVLSDGVVAFVRGVDYRIDYLHPDGTWTSSPKLPFDWQRVTEEDKQQLIDSVKTEQRRSTMGSYVSSMIRWVNQYGKAYPADFKVPEGYRVQAGLARDWKLPPGVQFPANYIFACKPGETPTITPAPEQPATPAGEPTSGRGASAATPARVTPGRAEGQVGSAVVRPVVVRPAVRRAPPRAFRRRLSWPAATRHRRRHFARRA